MEKARAENEIEGNQPQQGGSGRKGEKQVMNLFFDASAFVKRYIDESGSDEIEHLCAGADDVGVSILLPIEIVSTFSRLKREKKISEKEYTRLKEELFTDLRDVTIISFSPETVTMAIDSIERSPLKTLDAAHIGCALEYQPDFFVSSDIQQLHAAGRAGLRVKKVL
jgi:uncharacterized protein